MTTTLLIPNEHLLIETLDNIKAHPEDWYQENWRCGTTACFAGRTALLNGAEWAIEPGHHAAFMPEGGVRLGLDGQINPAEKTIDHDDVTWVDDEGQRFYQHVAAYARAALLLTGGQAADLFAASNSLEELERLVTRLTTIAEQRTLDA